MEAAHPLEIDRVVGLADLVAWVVEPQKYADAALHDQYLRPLASHGEAMAIVLNQADLLAPLDIDAWRADVARLLAEDGVRDAPLLVVSAETGQGLDDLRRLLAERVRARDAAVARLAADVDDAVEGFADACAKGARPAFAARIAAVSSLHSRMPPAFRPSCGRSRPRIGGGVRSRPDGLSSAGPAACDPILSSVCAYRNPPPGGEDVAPAADRCPTGSGGHRGAPPRRSGRRGPRRAVAEARRRRRHRG